MHPHLFGPLADQVDDFSDEIWTNAEALQNFLVFFQISSVMSQTKLFRSPHLWSTSALGFLPGNKRLSEARYASDKHARVNDGPWLAFLSFLQQR